MAINISSIQTFTDAELLILYRNGAAELAISQSTTINGRSVARSQLKDVREMIDYLESRIAAAAQATQGGPIAYVNFQDTF